MFPYHKMIFYLIRYYFRLAVGCSAYGIHFSAKFVNFDIFTVVAIKEVSVFTIILMIIPFFKRVSWQNWNLSFKCTGRGEISYPHLYPDVPQIIFQFQFEGQESTIGAYNIFHQWSSSLTIFRDPFRSDGSSNYNICAVPRIYGWSILYDWNLHPRCFLNRY